MAQGREQGHEGLDVLLIAEASPREDSHTRLHRAGNVGDAANDGKVAGDGGTPNVPADLCLWEEGG